MLKSIRQVVNGYADNGLLNREAIDAVLPKNQIAPLMTALEFSIDACALANSNVGRLFKISGGVMSERHREFESVVAGAIKNARSVWQYEGREVPAECSGTTYPMVSRYIKECFNARARSMFSTDHKYRDRLIAAMASAEVPSEKFNDVVRHLQAQPNDTYSDKYLDSVVRAYKS